MIGDCTLVTTTTIAHCGYDQKSWHLLLAYATDGQLRLSCSCITTNIQHTGATSNEFGNGASEDPPAYSTYFTLFFCSSLLAQACMLAWELQHHINHNIDTIRPSTSMIFNDPCTSSAAVLGLRIGDCCCCCLLEKLHCDCLLLRRDGCLLGEEVVGYGTI